MPELPDIVVYIEALKPRVVPGPSPVAAWAAPVARGRIHGLFNPGGIGETPRRLLPHLRA